MPFPTSERRATRPDAEALAIEALGFLGRDPERLSRFLGLTGLDAATLRQAAASPGFLGSVLDYVMQDESLLLALSAETAHPASAFAAAHHRLTEPR